MGARLAKRREGNLDGLDSDMMLRESMLIVLAPSESLTFIGRGLKTVGKGEAEGGRGASRSTAAARRLISSSSFSLASPISNPLSADALLTETERGRVTFSHQDGSLSFPKTLAAVRMDAAGVLKWL
jgi:hypothetical protein